MKIVKRVLLIIMLMVISIGLYIVDSGHEMYKKALEQTSLTDRVEQIRAKENYTTLKEVPPIYLKAVISVEDHRFYEHGGIDIIAIGRAVINDIKAMKLVEGGSTITQQLAKNMYFTQEKKFTRKVAEVFMAFEIEKQYSKEEILELYLNTSYYGDGYHTIKEACRGYFQKEPNQMTDAESILLAGIPNAPSIYAPTKNPELARQRQLQVMNKMIKYGYLTEEAKQNIINMNAQE